MRIPSGTSLLALALLLRSSLPDDQESRKQRQAPYPCEYRRRLGRCFQLVDYVHRIVEGSRNRRHVIVDHVERFGERRGYWRDVMVDHVDPVREDGGGWSDVRVSQLDGVGQWSAHWRGGGIGHVHAILKVSWYRDPR